MPKVSDAHRAARRDQILQAAWKCFAREGFHATSMSDVITEAGLSAGAVYLYFRSKDDIIVAVASGVFAGIEERLVAFVAQDPPPSPAEIVGFLVEQPVLARAQAPADLFPLLLSVWSEASRNPAVNDVARKVLDELRTVLGQAMHRWVDAGNQLSVHPDRLAPVMMALVQGMVMQQSVDGQPPFDDYRAAVRALIESAQVQTAQ
ncbi:MAG TPA: TetR/AcrR family transcriptional regulator [Nakamurella sp.]